MRRTPGFDSPGGPSLSNGERGNENAPVGSKLVTMLGSAVQAVGEYVRVNKGLVQSAALLAVSAVGAGIAIKILGVGLGAVGTVLGVVGAGLSTVGAVVGALATPIGLITAATVAGGIAWLNYTQSGAAALTSLGNFFGDLKDGATIAFKGIARALGTGDIAFAGQVLWASLKVEFLQGVNFLKGVWSDISTTAIEAFRGVSYNIAAFFIDALAYIESDFVKTIGSLKTLWTDFSEFFQKVWERVKNPFGGHDFDAAIAKIEQASSAARAGQEADQSKQLAGIEETRAGSKTVLREDQQREIDSRRSAAQQGIDDANRELETAKADLAKLLTQATDQAGSAAAAGGKPALPGGRLTPESVGDGLEHAQRTVETKGTFNAMALSGLARVTAFLKL